MADIKWGVRAPRLKAAGVLVAVLVQAGGSTAFAQTFSAMSPGNGTTVLINSPTNGLTGYSFVPNEDIQVAMIGVIDVNEDGLGASHHVGLFERGTGALLAQVTVPSGTGATLISGSRYVDISPVVIHVGVEYYLHADNFHQEFFRFGVQSQATSVGVDSHINWTSSVISNQTNSIFAPYVPDGELEAGYGPNFRFTLNPQDCNRNNIPDDMEMLPDCNGNGVPDECDVAAGGDCNANGIPDACDIALQPEADADGNGVLDVCERCAGDADDSGEVNVTDLLAVLAGWGPCAFRCLPGVIDPDCPADTNVDCVVDVADLLTLLANWGPCGGM